MPWTEVPELIQTSIKLDITRGTLPALPGISNFYLIKNFVKVHQTNETTLQIILMRRGIQNGTIHIATLSQGRKHLLANPDKLVVVIVVLGKQFCLLFGQQRQNYDMPHRYGPPT